MPDTTAIAARITENAGYIQALKSLFGPDVMDSPTTIFKAVTIALSAFQMSGTTSSFDSKYDRYLAGEEALNALEEQGRLLFFSTLVNCNTCHLIDRLKRETFTNYSYHNIGIPENVSLARIYAKDLGLAEHPEMEDPKTRGQFKVPTLRNIAVTAPYMHNGVFKELRTVLAFYNQFILQTPINPESGNVWRPPEVDENLSHDLLRRGPVRVLFAQHASHVLGNVSQHEAPHWRLLFGVARATDHQADMVLIIRNPEPDHFLRNGVILDRARLGQFLVFT